MKMSDIRDIQIKIRKKYSPEMLSPEILCEIIHILFYYIEAQTCRFCEDADNLLTKETCCTGCSKLKNEDVEEKIHEDKSETL